MIRVFAATCAGAIIILFALFWIAPHGAIAASCAGQMVKASWYGAESGNRTATGLRFNGKQWLVAHRTYKFGTKLRLTYHGKSVVVPVLDRGPFIKGRTLDLSRVVAVALGTIKSADGAPFVCMERLS